MKIARLLGRDISDKKSLKQFFEANSKQAFAIWEAFFEQQDFHPQIAWDKTAYKEYLDMLKGGKQIRANLCLFGWLLAGQKQLNSDILLVSGSIEVLHNAFLFHDDIVDKSDTRRGAPSLHKKYEVLALEHNFSSSQARDHGYSVALNIGDIGQALAQEMLLSSHFSLEQKLLSTKLYNKYLQATVWGQMLDLEQKKLDELSLDYIELLQTHKTAYYSFVLPLSLGFICGCQQAPAKSSMDLIRKCGEHLGIAFQMQDDLIGIVPSSTQSGKPVGDDILEGKKTLPMSLLYQETSQAQKSRIAAIWGNREAQKSDILWLIEEMKATQALKATIENSQIHGQKAVEILNQLTEDEDCRVFFALLVDFVCSQHKDLKI